MKHDRTREMITISENKYNLPAIQAEDYRGFFNKARIDFMNGPIWKKILDSFWQEMKLHVSPDDVEELSRFLRNKREAILENYHNGRFFQYWKDCFDGATKQHDEAKFIKVLEMVFDGQIDRSDFDAFFSWYCLTKTIDALLGQINEQRLSQKGTIINFFYNDGGEIHFGTKTKGKQKDAPVEEEPLKNFIFNVSLFDSNSRLAKLRDTIAAAIDMGEATIMYGKPQEVRINPASKNEWYYIVKAICESGVARTKISNTNFVEQMVEWFPMLFPDETPETFKDFKRKLSKSISEERHLWRKGSMKQEVPLKEIWSKGMVKVLGAAKAERVNQIANKGLLTHLLALKQDIERENSLDI